MIWSPVPKESYSVFHQGKIIGPHCAPFVDMPGVWNILWLSAREKIESLRSYAGDSGEFPVLFDCIPAIVGASLQVHEGATLGRLAEELAPTEWIDRAVSVPYFILARVYPGWELVARKSAAAFVRPMRENVIPLRRNEAA